MSECSNGEMRELLPDLLHEHLQPAARARVQTHVDVCAACRAELALLARVRSGSPAPRLDASRLAAAIPPYRVRSIWARAADAPALRIAAAIALVAGALWLVRRPTGGEPVSRPSVTAPAPASAMVAAAPSSEVTVGEPLADLSEGDLETLISELDELDAMTPAEADVDVPSIRGGD
jgi:hypothetical protein